MYGCIEDDPARHEQDCQRRPLTLLVGAPAPVVGSADLTPYLDRVLTQAGQDCVAHWFSSAIFIAGKGKLPRISRRWAYAVARYMRTPGVLVDAGSVARLMCEGSERHGLVSEERVPYEPSKIDEPPPFDADVAGADALFTGYYKVAGSIRLMLCRALDQGHCPGLALRVYTNWAQWSGDAVYTGIAGNYEGAHMVTIVGYRFRNGRLEFLVLNSWGEQWGLGGFIWMDADFVESNYCFDHMVVTSAPLSRG